MGKQLQLATLDWGERGPRALLIHGLTSTARSCWRLGAEMARAGYRVTAPDLRGHGDSPRGDDYLLASYATDVLALDREWDVVVGHSLGGASDAATAIAATVIPTVLPIMRAPSFVGLDIRWSVTPWRHRASPALKKR